MSELTRVPDPNHPERCEGSYNGQRCWYFKYPGSKHCLKHDPSVVVKEEQQAKRNYYLSVWRKEVNEKAESQHVKSLREEIGMLRVILEEQWNRCSSADQLLINSPRITELIDKLRVLVTACHTLEAKTRFLLDRSSIVTLCEQLLLVVEAHVTGETLASIANGFEKALVNSQEVIEPVLLKTESSGPAEPAGRS